ncbi:methyl-accepting chemotaxis protein [Cohnella cholangitidis]|uniref:Methyl-accepting chemotaxis protein n=1 Tax=Cohnella cholangitidis TaxID=2598458 RepID=A0A7G5BVN4_9BACL|nr:methyl-accepting chemotaxis protein [Cohnella cholangitidis]
MILRNLKLAKKMFAVLALSLVALLATNSVGIVNLNKVADRLITALYSDTYKGSEFMLNADRDLYQALVDKRTLLSGNPDSKEFNDAVKSYEENILQVRDRMQAAKQIYEQKRSDYETLQHKDTKNLFFEAFDRFDADFSLWDAETRKIIDSVAANNGKLSTESLIRVDDSKFHSARENLNELEEMISEHAVSYIDEVKAENRSITWMLIAIVILSCVAVLLIGWFLLRFILNGIKKVVAVTEEIVSGNLQVESIEIKSKDEIGMLAQSINSMSSSLRQMINKITETAHSLAAASKQISAGMEEISGSSMNQAKHAQTITELFKELSSAINAVANSAEDAAEMSEQTVGIAHDGAEALQSTMDGMNKVSLQMNQLEADSNQIGNIIEVIGEIAEQTNLLALNAAIEAARAGEQGRGFAVVADEVRKLAERSSEATKQITTLIQGMQKSTESSVRVVADGVNQTRDTGAAFERITQKVNQSASRVVEIAAASEEQAAQSAEVLLSVESIAASSQETAAASEQTAASAQSLAELAEELNRLVVVFKV